jgi:hypothetical protein
MMVEQVDRHNVERVGAPVFSRLEQGGANRLNGVVELLPLVTTESKSVTDNKAEQKRHQVEQPKNLGVREQFEKYWVHWLLIPAVWFLLGLIMGGAFERRR